MGNKKSLGIAVITFLLFASWVVAQQGGLDAAKIEQLTGAKGKMSEKEGVFKVSMPRSDMSVTAGGVKITPPMGLTCWAAFKPMGDHVMVMGDQVLLEDQVSPVMSAVQMRLTTDSATTSALAAWLAGYMVP